MNKQNTILTFDYEVFLGIDSGDIIKSLLEPTEKILEILKKNNAKGLFFIDTTFLLRMQEENANCYVKVKEQLHKILSYGSDIGLHIHPHWIDARSTTECRWTFEKYDNFRLHNLSEEERKALIVSSITLLNEIVHEYDENYKIETFRAGGWCIQPFDMIRDTLKEIGIKFDFSVLPGKLDDKRPRQYYDFRQYPKKKDFWYFNDDVLIEEKNGYFVEIPVTMCKMNLYDWIQNKKSIKTHKVAGDGRGGAKAMPILEKLGNTRWNMMRSLSSDYMSFFHFKKLVYKCKQDLIVYVAHPKVFSEDAYESLDYLCKRYNTVSIEQYIKS